MGFNGSRAQTAISAKAKIPHKHHPVPLREMDPKGLPKAGQTAPKGNLGKASGLEEHPVTAGQAREIPAGKQKPRLELEPCRKFGGCLVSQHLVNTSCGWRLTSSSTTPPSSHTHRPASVRGPQSAIEERGEQQPGENSAHQLFIWVRVLGFFPPVQKTQSIYSCAPLNFKLHFQQSKHQAGIPSNSIFYITGSFFVVFTTL